MPITTSPFTMKDTSLTLKLGAGTATEYKCQLTGATFTPSDATGGGGSGNELITFCATHTDSSTSGDATWTLDLEGFQSFKDAEDLAMFLFTNEGATASAVLMPGQSGPTIGVANPGFKADVVLKPTAIGGTARQYATFSVSLACKAKPVKVTA